MNMSKYSANGNDFIIFHLEEKIDATELAKELCHRQNGIGADGLIIVVPHDKYDFEWQFYNGDGTHADMCGNGSRAVAHYAFMHKLAGQKMSFLTGAGVINAEVEQGDETGGMIMSELTPPNIIDTTIIQDNISWWLINTGVPHLVALKDNIDIFDLKDAKKLRDIYNANVNIACLDDNNNIKVRTYERGVEDETLACGTGMAACFYRALKENLVQKSVKVFPKSGDTLYLGVHNETITFKGRVKKTFETNWTT